MQLGNMYFDAERFQEAVEWYEAALKIESEERQRQHRPRDRATTTSNQPDRALAQFERSLAIDPKHSKTLLNIGIVRAFGKQDLKGAAKAWQRVLDVAPDSPGGGAAQAGARRASRGAHPDSRDAAGREATRAGRTRPWPADPLGHPDPARRAGAVAARCAASLEGAG